MDLAALLTPRHPGSCPRGPRPRVVGPRPQEAVDGRTRAGPGLPVRLHPTHPRSFHSTALPHPLAAAIGPTKGPDVFPQAPVSPESCLGFPPHQPPTTGSDLSSFTQTPSPGSCAPPATRALPVTSRRPKPASGPQTHCPAGGLGRTLLGVVGLTRRACRPGRTRMGRSPCLSASLLILLSERRGSGVGRLVRPPARVRPRPGPQEPSSDRASAPQALSLHPRCARFCLVCLPVPCGPAPRPPSCCCRASPATPSPDPAWTHSFSSLFTPAETHSAPGCLLVR